MDSTHEVDLYGAAMEENLDKILKLIDENLGAMVSKGYKKETARRFSGAIAKHLKSELKASLPKLK